MRHLRTVSFDQQFAIEVKEKFTQDQKNGDFAIIDLYTRRDKVTLAEVQQAIVDCLDGTLEFRINPEYDTIVIYLHKRNGKWKRYVVENDIDSVLVDIAEETLI